MKFVIESISKSSGRLGQLVQAESGKQFKTPVLLQATKGGSIPYLSREVFDYVSKEVQLLQMSVATMQQMAESVAIYGKGLSSYVGFKDYPNVLIVRDPCELMKQGGNDRDVVPLFTRHGRFPISVEKYMDMVECFQPDIYQGLCDADTNIDSAKKRVQKALDRTDSFMNYCYERQRKSEKLKKCALFAAIVGGYSTFARSESIRHAKKHGSGCYAGYIIEGFHNYGFTATSLDDEKLLEVMRLCLNDMEVDKPKMLPGAYTPLLILELVRLGVDMFDSSYAYLAAISFNALTFNYKLEDEVPKSAAAKPPASPFLDISDESLKEDFTPFLAGCQCLACRQHTRAYVHHLYKTNELLGPILLMIHNLHHYMEYFASIRACIAKDTLPQLIELVKFQGGSKPVDYSLVERAKAALAKNPAGGMGKGFMMAAAAAGTSTDSSTPELPAVATTSSGV